MSSQTQNMRSLHIAFSKSSFRWHAVFYSFRTFPFKIKSQRVHSVLTFLQQLKRTQNLQASKGKKTTDANLVLDNTASMSPIDIARKTVSNLGILLHFFFGGVCILAREKKIAKDQSIVGKKLIIDYNCSSVFYFWKDTTRAICRILRDSFPQLRSQKSILLFLVSY